MLEPPSSHAYASVPRYKVKELEMAVEFGMDRRSILQNLAMLIGASVLPAEALATPKARRRAGATRFLTPAQFVLLSAVADTIIPKTDSVGAVEVKVPARIDLLLRNWASADTRSKIVGALAKIDAAARAQKQKGFAALSAADRAAVLGPHDKAALAKVPPPPNAPAANFFVQPNYVADPGYLKIKEMVLQLYYFSEAAASSELIYEHVPGKFEPSIKLTPKSRPFLGTGPF
jgi:gluconate 2-dehydrogenase gamma chain